MKKIIFAFLLVALLVPFSVGATIEEESNNSGWLINLPTITTKNYNTTVEGNNVTQTWLTNKFMTTEIVVINDKTGDQFVMIDQSPLLATFHVVSLYLPSGEYTLIPHSVYKDRADFYGKTVGVVVE